MDEEPNIAVLDATEQELILVVGKDGQIALTTELGDEAAAQMLRMIASKIEASGLEAANG